jgi:hypothetical protein
MAAKPIERYVSETGPDRLIPNRIRRDFAPEMASVIDLAILAQYRDGLTQERAWNLSWRAHGGGDEWQPNR